MLGAKPFLGAKLLGAKTLGTKTLGAKLYFLVPRLGALASNMYIKLGSFPFISQAISQLLQLNQYLSLFKVPNKS